MMALYAFLIVIAIAVIAALGFVFGLYVAIGILNFDEEVVDYISV